MTNIDFITLSDDFKGDIFIFYRLNNTFIIINFFRSTFNYCSRIYLENDILFLQSIICFLAAQNNFYRYPDVRYAFLG